MPRAPLVPRLLAQLVPTGDLDLVLPEVPPREAREDLARTQAQAVVSVGRERLERTLEQDYGLDRRRAVALAEQRTARWLPGLQKMLAAEGRTQAQRLLNDLPAWMAPHGQRQERSLALVGVLAWQGEELLEAVLAAAHEHLDQGRSGRWPELRLEIDA